MPSLEALQARLLDAGDRAFVVEFGHSIDPALFERVSALDRYIQRRVAHQELPGLCELIPTFRSLAIVFDPLVTTRRELLEQLFRADEPLPVATDEAQARRWRLPVCYAGAHGPDLTSVARATGLSEGEVCQLHQQTTYRVYMLGFMPGYAFMGDLPAALRLPRRTEPRVRIPAGSLAIALQLTGVYPWDSPGGWHLLGRCPIRLFDADAEQPTLLQPGDKVSFEPVSARELGTLEADLNHGRRQPAEFRLT